MRPAGQRTSAPSSPQKRSLFEQEVYAAGERTISTLPGVPAKVMSATSVRPSWRLASSIIRRSRKRRWSARSSVRTPDQLPGEGGLPARHDLVEDARLIELLRRVLRHAGGKHDRQRGGQGVVLSPGKFRRQVGHELLPVSLLANSVMRFSSGTVGVIRSVIGGSPFRVQMPVSQAVLPLLFKSNLLRSRRRAVASHASSSPWSDAAKPRCVVRPRMLILQPV